MTFLAPGAMLAGALIAGPLLIALYLLKLRRRPVRVSSITSWSPSTQEAQVNVPLRWLRASWLLLLHLAALACLLAALGRPAIPGPPTARLVLLIDTSASMSARDTPGGPTHLDQAKDLARALAAAALRSADPPGIAVIAFSADAAPLGPFSTSRAAVDRAILAAQATDEPATLGPALQAARALGSEAAAESAPRLDTRAIVFSDASWSEAPASLRGSSFEFIRAGSPTAPANVGIVGFSAAPDPDAAALVLRIDLISTAPTDTPVLLTIAKDDSPIASRAATVPAGATAITLRVPTPLSGLLHASLQSADALATDNHAWLIVPDAAPPALTLVTAQPGAASALLADVFSELPARSRESITLAEYERRADKGEPVGDVVIFDRASPRRAPAVPTLTLGVLPRDWPAPSTEIHPGALFWDRRHPALRDVTLDSLRVKSAPAIASLPPGWTPIVRSGDGPLVIARDTPPRQIAVLFDLADSNWPIQPGFPVFIAQAIDDLARADRAGPWNATSTGQTLALDAPPGADVLIAADPPRHATATTGTIRLGPFPAARPFRAIGTLGDAWVAPSLVDATESRIVGPDPEPSAAAAPAASGLPRATREIWPWFIAAALGILLVEWALYARAVRR